MCGRFCNVSPACEYSDGVAPIELPTTAADGPFATLLRRLSITPDERRVFMRDDTDAVLTKVQILTAAAVFFNVLAVDEFGGRPGAIRSRGLVEQVVGAA